MEQKIEIGPMSGKSNVIFWLEKRGVQARDELVEKILAFAKRSDRLLSETELLALASSSLDSK
jgi:2-isopropylmalate synthase